MGLDAYVNTFGAVCKAKYGTRLRKLTIDAKFTCPNRDGTLGRGGCTFCNVASFSHQTADVLSITEQLEQERVAIVRRNLRLKPINLLLIFRLTPALTMSIKC